jgi:hypothetical protein
VCPGDRTYGEICLTVGASMVRRLRVGGCSYAPGRNDTEIRPLPPRGSGAGALFPVGAGKSCGTLPGRTARLVCPMLQSSIRSGLPIDAGLAHSCLDGHQNLARAFTAVQFGIRRSARPRLGRNYLPADIDRRCRPTGPEKRRPYSGRAECAMHSIETANPEPINAPPRSISLRELSDKRSLSKKCRASL